ncbi:MAG: hypothetical protein ACHQF2_05835 [Flavobacteriales bacterium]
MKNILIYTTLITNTAFGQVSEFNGHSKTCDGNLMVKGFKHCSFVLKTVFKSKKRVYTYIFNDTYYLLQEKDTLERAKETYKETIVFDLRDSSLFINDHKLRVMGFETDSLISTPCLKYAYDDPDFPDDQMFYLFHPDVGLLKETSRVWFRVVYYYIDGANNVKSCACPPP